jgi:hypothetical protein
VISELRKSNCEARVKAWSDDQPPASLYLSRVTIAEIRYGIERLPTADRSRKQLEAWLTTNYLGSRNGCSMSTKTFSSSGVASWKGGRPCVIPSPSLICSSQQLQSCTICAS